MLQNFSESDRAVSPVIGVILMVAITVILAAVIATFVLDMSDDMSQTPTVKGQISDASETYGIDSTGDAIDIAHEGGNEIEMAKMKVVIRDSNGSPVMTFEDGSWSGVSNGMDTWELQINSNVVTGSETYAVGDTLTVVKSSDSGTSSSELEPHTEYEIHVVHTESNSLVLKSNVFLG